MAYNKMNESGGYPESSPQSPNYGWKPDPQPMPATSGASGSGGAPPTYYDPEDLTAKNFNFSEQSIRKGFIRKVYLILMAQLLVTFGFVALFVYHEPLQRFSQESPGLLISAAVLTLVVVVAMACCESARRTFPLNLICLSVFTLAESFLVATIAGTYESDIVLMAVGITAALCLALTLFAWQTKYDFTACGGFLLICLVCLMIFGFVGMFWRSHILHTVYAGCGAVLACVFLIYDTQIMMGGEHKYSISPEEYIFAALNLYMDVIRIFLFILQLLGNKK